MPAEDRALVFRGPSASPGQLPAATPARTAVPIPGALVPFASQTPTALTALDPSVAGTPMDCEAASRLVAAFLAGRNANTLRAYRRDLEAFATYAGADTVDAAAAQLLAGGLGSANAAALAWRASMVEQGLASSTVNRRLAALRSLVRVARLLGIVAWEIEVEGLRDEPYRDTRGPGVAGVQALMDQAARRDDAKGRRDAAIVRLAYDLGLRRGEIIGLDAEHLDLAAATVLVLGKGRRRRQVLMLPGPTKEALGAWVSVRGTTPGPLFPTLDRTGRMHLDHRMTGSAVYQVVRLLGEAVGVRARPHGLRHTAITEALETTNGNVRAAQAFSRHANVATVMIYDDVRQNLGAAVAAKVAKRVTKPASVGP